MGPQPNIFRHGLRDGAIDLKNWAKGHILESSVVLLTSLCGVPAYLLMQGPTVTNFWEQVAALAAYSIFGPIAVIAFAYVFFCLRAPYRLYAKRIDEIRDLRTRLGESIDDLEDPPPAPNPVRRFFARYGYPIAIVFLISTNVFIFYTLGRVAQAFNVSALTNKAFVAETKLWFMLMEVTSESGARICDKNKLQSKDCTFFRTMNRDVHTKGPYHGRFLPNSTKGVIPPLH